MLFASLFSCQVFSLIFHSCTSLWKIWRKQAWNLQVNKHEHVPQIIDAIGMFSSFLDRFWYIKLLKYWGAWTLSLNIRYFLSLNRFENNDVWIKTSTRLWKYYDRDCIYIRWLSLSTLNYSTVASFPRTNNNFWS